MKKLNIFSLLPTKLVRNASLKKFDRMHQYLTHILIMEIWVTGLETRLHHWPSHNISFYQGARQQMQHQLSFIAVAPDSATRVALETWLGQTTFGQSTSCPVQLLSAPKDASEVALVICWIPRALSNLTEHIWVFLYFAAITMDLGWPATLLQSTPQLRPHQGLRFGTLIFPIKTSSNSCVAKLAMKRFEQHRHKFCLPGKCSTSCQVIGSGDQWPDCRFIAFVTTPLVWKGWLISFGKAWDEKSFVIPRKKHTFLCLSLWVCWWLLTGTMKGEKFQDLR